MESLAPESHLKDNTIVFPLSDYVKKHPDPQDRCFDNFTTWFNCAWEQATIIKASGTWESGHHNYWDLAGVKYMQFSIEDVISALPSLDLLAGADVVALKDIPVWTDAQEFQFYFLMSNLEKRGGIYLIECWDELISEELLQICWKNRNFKNHPGAKGRLMKAIFFAGNGMEIGNGEQWVVLDFTGTIIFDYPDSHKDSPMPSINVPRETGRHSRKHDIDYKLSLLPEEALPKSEPPEEKEQKCKKEKRTKEEVDSIISEAVRRTLGVEEIAEEPQGHIEDYQSEELFWGTTTKDLTCPEESFILPPPDWSSLRSTSIQQNRRLEILASALILVCTIAVIIAGIWPILYPR